MLKRRRSKQNRGGVVAGFIFGLILTASAFVMLWLNEGRVNLADVARRSTAVSSEVSSSQTDNEFISITGLLTTPELLSDDNYLRPGAYLQIERTVEMYAWVEETESDDNSTNFTYSQVWTADPQQPAEMTYPNGHENPPLEIRGTTITANSAQIGAFRLDTRNLDLPPPQSLSLSRENVLEGPYQTTNEYIFAGEGTLPNPQIGDIRVSFATTPANVTMTAFGQQYESSLRPYTFRGDKTIYRALLGDRQQALLKLQTEYKTALWGFRIGGILLLWLGISLLFSPISRLLGYIPLLGKVGRGALVLVALLIALPLGLLTITISAILHNIWALIGTVALIGAAIYIWQRRADFSS